jgi:hypothetical protein
MHTHFCPTCGAALRARQCAKEIGTFRMASRLRCPYDDSPVQVSGVAFIIGGILIWFVLQLVLSPGASTIGYWLGGGLCAIGVLRIARQYRARLRRHRRAE